MARKPRSNNKKKPLTSSLVVSDLISLSDVAKQYGFKHDYLRHLASRGRLKAFKLGRNWFTTLEEMEIYIKSRKQRGVFRDDIGT
jgi:hypothetical protein